MKCDNCGRVLSATEIRGDECQYCGAVLPHVARAQERAAVAREVLADADGDGIPDLVQHLVPAAGGGARGRVQVNVGLPGQHAAAGPGAALPDDVRAQLAARGIDLSNAVVVSTTTSTTSTTSTSGELSPDQAHALLSGLGLGGAQVTQAAPPAVGHNAPPAGFAIGARVQVQWADGNRYPAQVVEARAGEYRVAFSDGRSMWVAAGYLSGA